MDPANRKKTGMTFGTSVIIEAQAKAGEGQTARRAGSWPVGGRIGQS
ncbi:hypothetical protein [Mucilaginibacter paludis]|uniref:Uncharacterized protein n=1 Tax=Mucilaginibacter paludis DSM 18603 TaxID=714943 RepID=H1YIQ1_9SPHI|nr:hypothetical protein [Mucilaginibacter paludis]EHQ27596.1 hypothetical protein Mucpa_3498 [Mucilaginibacter paludis DSM 18603]